MKKIGSNLIDAGGNAIPDTELFHLDNIATI
jgi:hypothetical protein